MLNTKTPQSNDEMNKAIEGILSSNGLSKERMNDGITIISTLVEATRVVSGESDGTKKDSADDIRDVIGTSTKKYADLVGEAKDFLNPANGVGMVEAINSFLDSLESTDEATTSSDDVEEVEEVVQPVAPKPKKASKKKSASSSPSNDDIIALVNDSVAKAMTPILEQMQSLIASVSQPQPVVVEAPKEQPKVEVEEDQTTSGLGLKKAYSNPSGWKDSTNYSVAVIMDLVGNTTTDKKYEVFVCRGMTSDEATLQGRKVLLRRIIQVLDASNGNKAITKATQSTDWMDVASESFGITNAVLDSLMTNANTYQQQTRRTGQKLRAKLGIVDTDSFLTVVNDLIENQPQPKVAPQPTSLVDMASPSPSVNASVDPNEVKKVMKQFGYGFDEAVAFLS